jgi:predicted amidophosphoribosyltransferase
VAYEGGVRKIVTAWKERGLRHLASWAAGLVVEQLERPDALCLVPVPGDAGRRLRRGHHAAERLAAELSELWELPLEPLLTRVRGSPRQRGLTQAERRRNVAESFVACAPGPARVALVDDVYTTGATAHAAASSLRRQGVKSVEAVTFARTIRVR